MCDPLKQRQAGDLNVLGSHLPLYSLETEHTIADLQLLYRAFHEYSHQHENYYYAR
jgi:hypothetical protein